MTDLTQPQQQMLEAIARADGSDVEVPDALRRALLAKGMIIVTPTSKGGRRYVVTAKGRALVEPTEETPSVTKVAPDAGPPRAEAAAPPTKDAGPKGKIGTLITLMQREQGASISDLTQATAWQAHSIRGAISGTIKKKLGLSVRSERVGDVRIYRIIEGAQA